LFDGRRLATWADLASKLRHQLFGNKPVDFGQIRWTLVRTSAKRGAT